ncbi:TlpA disulfide reductase family protein [Notoacmeibacter sp. MSK16QG-6]|uniref:thiol:disulfide interchange protein TlpA n=1 Tax=Notoacmeibacter sp. MSK16QG-6 TaxID=2957982 RepID=UPI00209E9A53|nr:TlpA disulfide reductase family protein [Notoacmeibacter sp. MSK16QG-6]MCP1199975.1 TlpA family protein disulfide reductase [Notoacmeibacter sp. MSK16QG-6]
MDEKDRPTRPMGRYVFIGFLILLAFTALLYVLGMVPGNGGGEAPVDDDRAAARCIDKPDLAKAIDDARVGEVAGVLASETQDLSDLSFNGPEEEGMTLAGFSGRAVLLNLWATWCVPCREEMPALDRLQSARGGEDFEVVAVNIDKGSLDKPRDFLDEIGVSSLALYHDSSNEIFEEMRKRGLALGLPATVLVDEDGCLRAQINGPAEWSSEEAIRMIDAVATAG